MEDEGHDIIGVTEIKSGRRLSLLKACIAELLGTLLLLFFGCGAAVAGSRNHELNNHEMNKITGNGTNSNRYLPPEFITQVSLTFGLLIAGVAQAIGHVSGGHINPAVTFGTMVVGQTRLIRGILYIVAQHVGAIIGICLLKAVTYTSSMPDHLGANGLQPGVLWGQGFLVEFMVTFILVLVVFGCCDTGRDDVKGSVPLAIGLTVTLSHLLAIGYTSAGLNPSRSIAPMLFKGYTEELGGGRWFVVYLVGPYLGGATAAVLYTFLFKAKDSPISEPPATDSPPTPSEP